MIKRLTLSVMMLFGMISCCQSLQANIDDTSSGAYQKDRVQLYEKQKNNEKKIQQIKSFLAGLGIGTLHGVINVAIADLFVSKGSEMPFWVYILTWLAITKLENTYNDNTNPYSDTNTRSTHWGRGIGQFVTENLLFKDPYIYTNISLIGSILS